MHQFYYCYYVITNSCNIVTVVILCCLVLVTLKICFVLINDIALMFEDVQNNNLHTVRVPRKQQGVEWPEAAILSTKGRVGGGVPSPLGVGLGIPRIFVNFQVKCRVLSILL